MQRTTMIAVLALGAAGVAGVALATRYEYIPVSGQLVRVDRWTGRVLAAKPSNEDTTFQRIEQKGRAITLPEAELARVNIDGRLVLPERSQDLRPQDGRLELRIQNQSTYTVEWFDVQFDGEDMGSRVEKAFTELGPGSGPRPGSGDTFNAPFPRDAADRVRTWRVVAAYGYPPSGQR
jgi:hypothetical protein